ncbi:hypothetical protein BAOM_3141 [Peribacillus asahii]|uniref:DUF2726 domain-containing protein n=1 Tax=Peribacillus asahii TaxID=228899 RepID=A0A3T0KTX8_9BACI|nr:hypothetical protein [Peribacillus asahii]AZV43750.1 hypothetical protein BAOM_3141 [Peribacillus asahii]
MPRKKTHEEFVQEVKELVGDEYAVLETYKNAQIKIKIRHNNESCNNYEWNVIPSGFVNSGSRCPKCSGNIKKTTEEFKQEVFKLTGSEYEVLGEYINNKTPIKMRHTLCGCDDWMVTPDNFLRGNKCYKCSGKMKKNHEEFKQEVYSLVGDEYTVLGIYKNAKTKVKMKHNICGYDEWNVIPKSFLLNGRRCPKCANGIRKEKKTKSNSKFEQEVFRLVGIEYQVLGEYVSAKTKITIKHNKCGYDQWDVAPYSFLQGTRCPKCNAPKGETLISKCLDNYNIKYVPQYRFDDCKYKNTLPFDFAIFKEKELLFLIEYDGIQHFEPQEHFGGEEVFKVQQLKDQIKNMYCTDNNIPLYRIPYWKLDEIEDILNKIIYNKHTEVDKASFLVL